MHWSGLVSVCMVCVLYMAGDSVTALLMTLWHMQQKEGVEYPWTLVSLRSQPSHLCGGILLRWLQFGLQGYMYTYMYM